MIIMTHLFKHKGILSIFDLSEDEIEMILERAEEMKKEPSKDLLQGCILASCFFEPSTRTRLSFESAMLRLGGSVIGFSDSESTSSKKGESLQDSIKVIGQYADIIAIRHPREGAARLAQESTDIPVVNAGDGANQHPTQTLVDLFTIKECQGTLHSLHIAMVGDLKYGRTPHSLALACALFDARLYFISPEQLTVPDYILHELRKKGVKFSFHHSIEEVIPKIDILYMTRIQKERFEEGEYERIKDQFVLKEPMLKNAKQNLKIFHPLPRINEIETAVDETPYAYYFQQAANGIYVRQAVLALLLNK
ncbi:MAG TPA: aspartate carbamoyltransferase [Rhabdochlamydiaceae bacterium]|nr:aspartate carbamoyltransferase [Rhabdochlamydiaceae bacterium]